MASRGRPAGASVLRAQTKDIPAAQQALDRSAVTFNKVVAAIVLVLIGMRIDLPLGLTVGYVAAAALAPVWLRTLSLYRGAWTLMGVGLAAVASGLWLTAYSSSTHDISMSELAGITSALVGILCSTGFVLWARTMLPDTAIAIWFAVGIFGSVSPASEGFQENAWRFGYSFAVTLFVLAIARRRGRWVELIAALALTAVNALSDARSSFGILLLTVVLVAWQLRPARPTRTKSGARVILALAALAVAVYNLGQEAIVAGYFGEATRERTLDQLHQSGSLILGGRPELTATLALMQRQPWGYGTGTLLNTDDVLAAKTGMATINYDPNNGYVERFMFGDRVELHSITGDLWVHFGIPGLVLALVILILVLRGVGVLVSANTASAVLLFLAVNTFWLLFFGPLYSASRLLILVLGLALLRKDATTPRLAPGLQKQPALT